MKLNKVVVPLVGERQSESGEPVFCTVMFQSEIGEREQSAARATSHKVLRLDVKSAKLALQDRDQTFRALPVEYERKVGVQRRFARRRIVPRALATYSQRRRFRSSSFDNSSFRTVLSTAIGIINSGDESNDSSSIPALDRRKFMANRKPSFAFLQPSSSWALVIEPTVRNRL